MFIICGEVFLAQFQKSIASSELQGIKIVHCAPIITHSLFADDSSIFARVTKEEAECLKDILATYERASGKMINLDKLMRSVSKNVPQNRFYERKQLLKAKAVGSFDKYLGLPTMIGKSKTKILKGPPRFVVRRRRTNGLLQPWLRSGSVHREVV